MATVTSHAPGTPCWVDLVTPDAEKARAFYGGLFGWTFDVMGPEMGFYTFAKLGDRVIGGIGTAPPEMKAPPAWTPYLATADAAATLEAVEAHGGKLLFGPMEIPQQGVQVVAVDNVGAAFGFWEPKPFPGTGALDEPGAPTWFEVASRDAARAKDFYTTVFGLPAERMPGDAMEYYVFNHDGKARYGAMQMTAQWPAEIPPHWMVYFAVADVDAAAARVAELGGTVHVKPFDSPYGRISVVADPAGATFSIMRPSQLANES